MSQELFDAVIEENKKRQRGIMFGLPIYGGVCQADFALALMRTVSFLTGLGFRVNIQAMMNESLITRARNNLAYRFMQDESMDWLMFIDADIAFHEHDVLKLILAEKEFVGGVYPRKRIHWDSVARAARAGKDNPEDWSCSYLFNAVGMGDGEAAKDGLVEVTHAATGFLLLARSVFERMQPHAPSYQDVVDGVPITAHDLFRVGVGPNGRYTSEDYWFCNEWRQLGGRIYINPYIRLGHIGTHTFNGNLARMGTEPL